MSVGRYKTALRALLAYGVALLLMGCGTSTSFAANDGLGKPGRGLKGMAALSKDFEDGRDFLKAVVFGMGPKAQEVSAILRDPEYDAFLSQRINSPEANRELDKFFQDFERKYP